MDHVTAQSEVHEAEPHWDSLPEDIPCPRCGYNLRMLPQPRCPECGLGFAWNEVIESARLATTCRSFEHQWRARPVWSFCWTVWQLLRPWRFWRDSPLGAPPRIGGLVSFALVVVAVSMVLGFMVDLAAGGAWVLQMPAPNRARRSAAAWAWRVVHDWYVVQLSGERILGVAVVLVVFTAITWLCFSLFWQTRRRYKLVAPLRARIILFSIAGFVICWHVVYVGQTAVQIGYLWADSWPQWSYFLSSDLATLLGLAFFYVSLGYALSRHARVERGWSMVVLIAGLQLALMLFVTVVSAVQFDTADNPVSRTLRPLFSYLMP